jgi:Protein of unknown function (DUF3035)
MTTRRIQGSRIAGAASWSVGARFAVVALAVGLLAGCGSDTRKMLGLDKTSPDEFKIVSRAPLSLPPDYALRPPEPGAVRPQEQTIPQRALAAVTGNAVTPASAPADGSTAPAADKLSVGESALLTHAGAQQADSQIRETVDRETSSLMDANNTFLDHLMFWRSPEDTSPVVDPQRESQRLRENAALGKPVDDGETPTIQRRKKALLEGIF